MNTLPRYETAVIRLSKFTEYALNPQKEKNKATAFEQALGYDMDNAEALIQNIRDHLPLCVAYPKPDTGYGQRYQVNMKLKGPNGKLANVLTAWIDDRVTGEMRLTSAYVDD